MIRVFVSSTFRDMRVERDRLAKFIFPQVRSLCEERSVSWGYIDLRWGITDEQTSEGKVLPICLKQIDRCRPFFICLLGERYGWVPDKIPSDLIKQQPWMAEHLNSSVTELEILHGVLNNPQMSGHALFYFRDPDYLRRISCNQDLSDYRSEDIRSYHKLTNLKNKIRASGFPVRENYSDPEALGENVLYDLKNLINRLFPQELAPDFLDQEALGYDSYARKHTQVYIGRQEYFDRLDSHVASEEPPIVIRGESGCGKSALVSNWALRYIHSHPDIHVILYFIGSSPRSAIWDGMLRTIMGEFKRKYDIEIDIPDDSDILQVEFANWLNMVAAKARVILIIDGLNQLEDSKGALDIVWLPPNIPSNIRMILSTAPGRCLNELIDRDWPVLTIDQLTVKERGYFIKLYLQQHTKELDNECFEYISYSPQCANPLFLKSFLGELNLVDHDELYARIDHYLKADSALELYKKIISRWERDYNCLRDGIVRDSASVLWASQRGLSESELLDLLSAESSTLSHASWAPFYNVFESVLINRSGKLTYSNQFIRQAVENYFVSDYKARKNAHNKIANYLFNSNNIKASIGELAWQFSESENWDQLALLLSNPTFFYHLFSSSRSETKRYWNLLEQHTNFHKSEVYSDVILEPAKYLPIALKVSDLLDETGHLEIAARLLEKLLRSNSIVDNYDIKGACHGRLGIIKLNSNRFDEAISNFQECLNISEINGDEDLRASSLTNMALVNNAIGERHNALSLLDKALHIKSISNKFSLSKVLLYKASILFDIGEIDDSYPILKKAHEIASFEEDNDTKREALSVRSRTLYELGELDKCETIARECELISRQNGDLIGLASSLIRSGVVCKAKGDYDRAISFFKESATIYTNLNDLVGLSHAEDNQAETLIRMHRFQEALVLNEKAIKVYREKGIKKHLSISLLNKAILHLAKNEFSDCLSTAKEAEEIAREVGDSSSVGRSLNIAAEIYRRQNNYGLADSTLLTAIKFLSKVKCREALLASYLSRGVLLSENMKRPLEALAVFDEAIELSTKYGFRKAAVDTLLFIFMHFEKIGELEISLTAVQELIRLVTNPNESHLLARANLAASDLLYRMSKFDEAATYCDDSLCLSKKLGDQELQMHILFVHSKALRNIGKFHDSLDKLQKAQSICHKLKKYPELTTCIRMQAQIYWFDMQKSIEAKNLLNQALPLAKEHSLETEIEKITTILKSIE